MKSRWYESPILTSRWALALGDALALSLAILAAFYVRYNTFVPEIFQAQFVRALPLWIIVNYTVFSYYRLYRDSDVRKDQFISKVVTAQTVSFVLALAISYVLKEWNLPRPVMGLAFIYSLPFTLVGRIPMWYRLKAASRGRTLLVNVPFSNDPLVAKAREYIDESPHIFEIGQDKGVLQNLLDNPEVKTIIVGSSVPEAEKKNITVQAITAGKEVQIVPDWFHILLTGAKLDLIGDTPTLSVRPPDKLDRIPIEKRLLDVTLSLFFLIFFFPLMLLIALAIRLDSKGPILFKQERVGLGNRTFTLLKFRTMIDGAEKSTGPVLAVENDDRLTRVGRFLRTTRLDELPQLINVIKGDMSLVGPRPERPFFVDQFINEIPHYDQRLRVPGGITGLAQIHGRYSTSAEDKLRYDLMYAGRINSLVDMKILLKTLKAMVNRSSAS